MQYEALHRAFWDTGTFWVTVAVALFLFAFGGRIVKGVVAAVDARADRIRADIAEAQRLRAEAERMLREAEERRTAALADAKRITADAEQRAARMAEALARDAEEAQVRRERVVAERIDAAGAAAVRDVREAATAVAVEAATRVLAEMLGPDDDRAGIDRAVAALPGAFGRSRAA